MISLLSNATLDRFSLVAATLAVNLLLQTTLVLGLGLMAARRLRSRGAALQSCVLRSTVAAVLICPFASLILYAAGVPGFRIELPITATPLPELIADVDQTKAMLVERERPAVHTAVNDTAIFSPESTVLETQRSDSNFPSSSLDVQPAHSSTADLTTREGSVPVAADRIDVPIESTSSVPTSPSPTSSSLAGRQPSWIYLTIGIGWYCASGLMLLRLLLANLLMERLRARSSLASDEVIRDCREIANQMSVKAPPVLTNPRLSSPCLLGWLCPAVMIPANLHPISSDVLAHELAHLLRRDCLWSFLGHLTTALLPWQPLLWLLTRQMEQAADNVCDDYVVAHSFDRASYARELVAIAERFPASWSATTAAVGIAEFRSCLGHRVLRILDSSRTLSLRTGGKHLVLTVVAALAGTAIAGMIGAARHQQIAINRAANAADPEFPTDQTEPADSSTPDRAVPANNDSRDEVKISGLVLKPDGIAAAGATVRLGVPIVIWYETTPDQRPAQPLSTVTADDQGHFEISVRRATLEGPKFDDHQQPPRKSTCVTASLDGFGANWIDLENLESDKPLTLKLVEDQIVRGQVVDLDGNPIRHNSVTITRVDRLRDESPTQILHSITSGSIGFFFGQPFPARQSIGIFEVRPALIGLQEQLVTDDDGWLEIRGAGKERLIHLAVAGGEHAYRIVTVANRHMEAIQPVSGPIRHSIDEPIYGSPFKVPLPPSRPITGIVIDAATGMPVEGVNIGIRRRYEMEFRQCLNTRTDSAGKFRLMGVEKKEEVELQVIPADGQSYFRQSITVGETPGLDPVELKVSLQPGVWIRGRVTNKMTHEPVSGVHVHYYPLYSNPFAQAIPNAELRDRIDEDYDQYQSDQDGNYRLLGLPGPALVGTDNLQLLYRQGEGLDKIKAPRDPGSKQFLAFGAMSGFSINRAFTLQEIDLDPNDHSPHLEIELDPGYSVRLRLVDEDGVSVKGATVSGTRWNPQKKDTNDEVMTVLNLGPDDKRTVYAYHRERDIGLIINLEPPYVTDIERTFVLRPLAKIRGRLTDAGQPIEAHRVDAAYEYEPGKNLQIIGAVETNAEGQFELTVIPGHPYKVHMAWGGLPEFYGQLKEKLTFEPGEIKDLGDLELRDREFVPLQPIRSTFSEPKERNDKNGAKAKPNGKPDRIVQSETPSSLDKTQAGARSIVSESVDEVVFRGTVLKPDGTPAVGATIRSAAPVTPFLELRIGHSFVSKMVETIADDQGRFTIAVGKTPYRGLGDLEPRWLDLWKESVIAASLKGFGPAWVEYADIENDKPLTLNLIEDEPIHGQIVDLEGNPIRGTSVRVRQVQLMKDGGLDRFLRDEHGIGLPLLKQPLIVQRNLGLRDVDPRLIGLAEKITTNDEGWIQIPHVGQERLIRIDFPGGDIAYRTAIIVCRDTPPIAQPGNRQSPRMPPPEPVYGANFKLAISPSRPVEGVVVDAKTGQPLPGFSVEIDEGGEIRPVRHAIRTTTDQGGRFRLMGLSKDQTPRNRIVAIPPKDQPYFPRTMTVPDSPGLDPIEVKIEAHRGIWIKGKVTNKASHQPVAGMRIHYYPYQTNEFAKTVPTYRQSRYQEGDYNLYITDLDGSYSLVGLPGQGVVGLENEFMSFIRGTGFEAIAAGMTKDGLATYSNLSGPRAYHTFLVCDINAAPDTNEVPLELEVDPGVSVRIRVVDQQGQPVPETRISGMGVGTSAKQSEDSNDVVATIENINPDQSQQLDALEYKRHLGLKFQLDPPYDPDQVITVVLQPLAMLKGRLLDGTEPIVRASINPSFIRTDATGKMQTNFTFGSFATNETGHFECPLLPGYEYQVRVDGPGIPIQGRQLPDKYSFTAGQTIDLGELELGVDGFHPVKNVKSK